MDEGRLEEEHSFLDHAKGFQWETVKAILSEKPDLINVQPCGRWSALHQAAFEGNAEMCSFLIELGANASSTTRSGKTPHEVAKGDAKRVLSEGCGGEASGVAAEVVPPPMKKAKKATIYTMNINGAVDKEYEGCSLSEIASAPVSALSGVSSKGGEILKKFGIKRVRDLGRWKFYRMAKGIVGLSNVEAEDGRVEESPLNMNKALDKKHEGKALVGIIKLPPSALQGLAEWADAELAHFRLKTIGALGEWKFARWAEWITDLAEYESDDIAS